MARGHIGRVHLIAVAGFMICRWGIFLISSLLGSWALAQAQAIHIRALYDDRSFIPQVLIPFQVQGDLITSGAKIRKLDVVDAKQNKISESCKGIVDPYYPSIFLIKCTEPSNFHIKLELELAGKGYALSYRDLKVIQPGEGLVVVDPNPTLDLTNWNAGRALYNTLCNECHLPGPRSTKKGATVSRIQLGIKSIKEMQRSDLKALTEKQLKQIEVYLGKP